MIEYIISAMFIVLPAAALIFFIVSLCGYISACKANKRTPGSFSEMQIKDKKLALIISGVIIAVMLAVIIGFTVLIYLAIAYM